VNNDDCQQKKTKQKNNRLRNTIIIAMSLLIALAVLYFIFPVFQPYQSLDKLPGKSEITNGKITSVTVARMGINGDMTTNSEIIQQWSDFLKTANYKPKFLFVFGKKPAWVNITMEDGTIYYFEKWPDFKTGGYVYQFDHSETAERLFNLVTEDPNRTAVGIKKGL